MVVPDLLGRGNFTRDEVQRLEDTGGLTRRYELLEGDLIDKICQNPPHSRALNRVFAWLLRVFGDMRLRGQEPIEVAPADRRHNDPQPDIAVVAVDKLEYDQRHPRGDELVLIVDIADSTSRFDRSIKVSLYARAGVPEYWVLDVPRRLLIVHRALLQGAYGQRVELAEHEYVSLGDARALVADLLPRPIVA